MHIACGIEVQESDDRYILEIVNGSVEVSISGAFWVNIYFGVPSWFPGAGFQKKAALPYNLV
jgi:hypothetical protein